MIDCLRNLVPSRDTFRDAARSGNVKVLLSLLGPAMRAAAPEPTAEDLLR